MRASLGAPVRALDFSDDRPASLPDKMSAVNRGEVVWYLLAREYGERR
ncbi:MAG: hypothetical protein RMK99_10060 [Anaerolineales bacterium]|nr:hypothetical protein [Anaerolineales bacterium]